MFSPLSLVRRCTGAVAVAALVATSMPMYSAEPSYYGPQPATEKIDLNMYARIRTEGLNRSHVMELASALMDGIGPRLTGSPNMKKANDWTMNTLKGFGLQNAHLEDWGEFGMSWYQVNSWARLIAPDTQPEWIQAAPWSASTAGPVSGDVVNVDVNSEEDLAKYKGKLAGKIVLYGSPRAVPDLTEPLFSRYTDAELKALEGPAEERRFALPNNMTREQYLAERARILKVRQAAVKMMADEGVKAILIETRDGGKGGGTGIIFDDNTMNLTRNAQKKENAIAVPYAVMMPEGYGRIYRLLKAHVPVQMEVNIETKTVDDRAHGYNTVAEIPGTDPALKDQVVMVGGHLDSWIAGTGATDNGAGSVVAMEAVRILKALNIKPRRTIRIALWSGEEQGLYGSQGYVKQHFGQFEEKDKNADPSTSFMRGPSGPLKTTKEWEKLDAYYNLDNGTGRIRGVWCQGNYAIGPIFQQWLAPLADLGASTITYRDTGGTDHLSFDAVGLPGFQFIQDEMDYETRTHHSNMDTVEHLKPADLMQAATIEAIFLYNTAQRDEMMPRKPFPQPEEEGQRRKPLQGIFPNAIEPDAGKPGIPAAKPEAK